MMFWQAELKNLLKQLQSYREAQEADERANAARQGETLALNPPTWFLSPAQRVIPASTVASLVGFNCTAEFAAWVSPCNV
jgi:hypothetical protein